jgi:hypothetical protein
MNSPSLREGQILSGPLFDEPTDLPDPEELEEMEEGERERLEELLEAITLAENADQVRDEIEELLGLAEQAKNVEDRNNVLRRYEQEKDWKLPALANKYTKCSTDRETAESNDLEWVTPGHPLFEAIRRHSFAQAREALAKGACFYSLQHESPARMDFYRACIVDGLGDVIHERMFAIEIAPNNEPVLQEPIKDPARFDWHEVTKVAHYYLAVDAMTRPMKVREEKLKYEETDI